MFKLNRKTSKRLNQIARSSMLLESLESRQLMSGDGFSAQLIPQGNGSEMLLVYGQVGVNDNIAIYQNSNGLSVYDAGQYEGTFNAGSVAVFGRRGDKMIDIDLSVTVPAIVGTGAGNDTVLGGAGWNYIADRRVGNSLLVANSSDTTLIGSKGNDTLVALQGNNDTLVGGIGTDSFWVNANGNDTIQSNNPGEWIHYVNSFQSYQTQDAYGNDWTTTPGMERNPGYFAEPGTNGAIHDTASWQDISNMPLFGANGPVAADINQCELGDCYFMSTLASIANVDPNILRQNITSLGDGTFAVQFTINGQTEFFRVDGQVPFGQSGTPEYANFGTGNSIWVPIYEKAFAEARPSNNYTADYGNIEGGYPSEVYNDFNASNVEFHYNDEFQTGGDLVQWILNQQAQGKAVEFCSTSSGTDSDPADANGIYHNHAYTIIGVFLDANGNEVVQLRNPWGNTAPNDGYINVSVGTILNSLGSVQSATI